MAEVVDIDEVVSARKETQWAKISDKVFTSSGEVTDKLVPGYYDLQESWGNMYFIRQNVEISGLLKTDQGNAGEIISDIEKFWDMEEKYVAYKMPYKRGLMLSGPPGTGKTCIIKLILADIIQRGGICIETDGYHIGNFKDGYEKIRAIQPDIPIVGVMEDMHGDRISSGLLNMLDGLVPLHKVVMIGTTNHPDSFPDAIINRPGRFDAHYRIMPPSGEARKVFLENFVAAEDLARIDLAKWIEDTEGFSMGHLKELVVSVMVLGKGYDEMIGRLRTMKEGITEEDEE